MCVSRHSLSVCVFAYRTLLSHTHAHTLSHTRTRARERARAHTHTHTHTRMLGVLYVLLPIFPTTHRVGSLCVCVERYVCVVCGEGEQERASARDFAQARHKYCSCMIRALCLRAEHTVAFDDCCSRCSCRPAWQVRPRTDTHYTWPGRCEHMRLLLSGEVPT